MPVYSIQGSFGYVWIANYGEQSRGTLRFLAVNAAQLAASFRGQGVRQAPQPTLTGFIATTDQKPPAQQTSPSLQQQLQDCGDSYPDKPELDKLRRDTLAQLE